MYHIAPIAVTIATAVAAVIISITITTADPATPPAAGCVVLHSNGNRSYRRYFTQILDSATAHDSTVPGIDALLKLSPIQFKQNQIRVL